MDARGLPDYDFIVCPDNMFLLTGLIPGVSLDKLYVWDLRFLTVIFLFHLDFSLKLDVAPTVLYLVFPVEVRELGSIDKSFLLSSITKDYCANEPCMGHEVIRFSVTSVQYSRHR